MTVLFRTDASVEIGTGHLMRCLALAGAVKALGDDIVFVCREVPPPLADRIRSDGYDVKLLIPTETENTDKFGVHPYAHWLKASWYDDAIETMEIAEETEASWVVVDHYGLDADWERMVANGKRKVAVLDDLADRQHAAALLVDPSLTPDRHDRYQGLMPAGAEMLLGPHYAALRQEFSGVAGRPTATTDEPMTFLIAFGGVDAAGMTRVAMDALASITRPGDHAHVVVGAAHGGQAAISARCRELGWTCHINSNRMASLMAASDIAIGAGGSMVWERMAVGVPTIAIIVADNQQDQVDEAADRRLLIKMNQADASVEMLAHTIQDFRQNVRAREAMAASCRRRVDGGGARRIARRIMPNPITMRLATATDSMNLLIWRNDKSIRLVSHNAALISPEKHNRWLNGTLNDPARRLMIGEDAAGPVGVVRFDRTGRSAEVSIYLTPDRLGTGLGAPLLLAAEADLAAAHPEITGIVAEVLPTNGASKELFLSCGYRFASGYYRKPIGNAR